MAIGIYLIPVGIQYAAGGAGEFNMSKPTWGGIGNWSLAIIVIVVLGKMHKCNSNNGMALMISWLSEMCRWICFYFEFLVNKENNLFVAELEIEVFKLNTVIV